MNILKINLPILLVVLAFGLNACEKKCVVEKENLDSGSIVKNVIFYLDHGYMTSNMWYTSFIVNASHVYANEFQVSIDGSEKKPVNYSNYNIMCFLIVANCNAFYDRNVTIDHTLKTVVYKIVVTQCANCKEQYNTENYVLVPVFPSNYAVSYEVSYIDK